MNCRLPLYMILSVIVGLFASASASAGIMGAEVNVSAYYPNSSSLFSDPGNVIVSGAVEYPAGSYSGYGPIEIDLLDDQLIITNTSSAGYSSGAFNGFILEVISGDAITGISLDGSSTIAPTSFELDGNGRVLVNFAGQGQGPGFTAINLQTTPVPEPASMALWSLFGLGMVGSGYYRTRRNKRA